jgi:glycosyltransferase involved in cell wall biosynthesis
MKVAIVLMHPFSESMGSIVRVRELALSLGKAGVEVYIINPYERSFDIAENVHVISSASRFFQSTGLSKQFYLLSRYLYYNRIYPYLYSTLSEQIKRLLPRVMYGIADFCIKQRIDIIQVEQDASVPLGIALKEMTSLPLIVDIHNITSEELVASGSMKRDSEEFDKMQDSAARGFSEADHLVVVSEQMQKYVVSNYNVSSNFVTVVPPGGRPTVSTTDLLKRVKPFKIVYGGLVATREHIDLFVRSMPLVKDQEPSVRFFITKKGEGLSKIRKLSKELNVKPDFYWYDDYDKANMFISSCHLGILCSSNDLARQMGTPAKLFTYMSAGLPIIANKVEGWSRIIEEEQVGLLTDNSPEDFARAINELLANEDLQRRFSENALYAVTKKYNWDRSCESLEKTYLALS